MKNSANEMENVLEPYGNRADDMEERISDLEDRNLEMVQVEEEMLRLKKERERSYESYSTSSEGQHKDAGFPRKRKQRGGWGTELVYRRKSREHPKAKRTPGYLEAKRPFPRHILNLSKVSDKQRVLKAIRKERKKKTKTYKGIPLG